MQENLINKLLEYIRENNPDLLVQLEDEGNLMLYLTEKISAVTELIEQLTHEDKLEYMIEETCIDILTKDLRPSRFNYLCNILEEEFEATYQKLVDNGLLRFEAINLVDYCQPVFDDLKFSEENEDNQFLRYAIAGAISECLERNVTSENEIVSNGLQQSAETEG